MTPIGKTLGEIDQEEQRNVDEANKALESLSGAEARWWSYSVSHRTFEIVVGDPLGKGNVVLCLNDCRLIAGPVKWPNQRLRVIWKSNPPEQERSWSFALEDDSVGFRVEAGCFGWRRDYDIVAYGSMYFGKDFGKDGTIQGRALPP